MILRLSQVSLRSCPASCTVLYYTVLYCLYCSSHRGLGPVRAFRVRVLHCLQRPEPQQPQLRRHRTHCSLLPANM